MNESRASSSALVVGVAHHLYERNEDAGVTLPDCCSDLLVIKQDGKILEVILTGAITQPIPLDFGGGIEVLNITFKPDTFFPDFPATSMLNKGQLLPSAGKNKVWLGSEVVEVPDFNTAENFVEKLCRTGALKTDRLVGGMLSGNPLAASERSVQRHFLQTTGMTLKFMQQVQRAQLAVEMIKRGQRINNVAHMLNFTDQAHMTKSLKGIMGITPAVISKQSAPAGSLAWLQELGVPLYQYGL